MCVADRSRTKLHHDVFVVLIIPTCLRHRRCRCRPPKMPFSKSAQRDLQEIARVSVVVVLRRDAVAVVTLLFLPPNKPQRH